MPQYADIVLPLATPAPYTYIVPEGMDVRVGARVTVALGKTKTYTGIVTRIHDDHPLKGTPRPIIELIDHEPVVTRRQTELWKWVADYYMAPIGEVMRQGLPPEIRNNRFTPPAVAAVRMAGALKTEEDIHNAFESLRRSPAGRKAFAAYLEMLPEDSEGKPIITDAPYVPRNVLSDRSGASTAVIVQLCLKGIFEQQQVPVSEFGNIAPSREDNIIAHSPSDEEAAIGAGLEENFKENGTILLHQRQYWDKEGLYRLLAEKYIAEGGQILILQPDIASTISLAARLSEVLGDMVALFHSRMTDHARSTLYYSMATDPASTRIIVGTRGALFLPFAGLRLIVVESEQSFGYKQSENAPRYNARDVSLVVAASFGARCLLTSEAPSLESYYNTLIEKWGKVVFPLQDSPQKSGYENTYTIYNSVPPKFTVIERGKGLLSTYLKKRIAQVIERGHQVLIFQNRRGFASYMECTGCFHTPLCANCNVTLTYHKSTGSLTCHYCGYTVPYNEKCTACGNHSLVPHGIGTENIEQRLEEAFPDIPIARLDYDTTRRNGDFLTIANDFADSKSRILVGTQMIVNGIDFSNVALVAIANADNLLSAADFRTSERAFQLLTLLSNRVGAKQGGEVIIQTSKRLDPVIIRVSNRDSDGFYTDELVQRQQMKYPPAVRMIMFTFRHSSRNTAQRAAAAFDEALRPVFGSRLSPGFEPAVDRTRGEYIIEVMLRIERNRSASKAKAILSGAVSAIRRKFSSVSLSVDVDPV